MNYFNYKEGELFCEGVPVKKIARDTGTPFYLYSHATLLRHYKVFDDAVSGISHITCYAYKANSNLALCRLLAKAGGGADVVSGGELRRALEAGVPAGKIVFNGNGKTEEEIRDALRSGILMFVVDSEEELKLINGTASSMRKKAPVALRLNPSISAGGHSHIATGMEKSKFGIPASRIIGVYKSASRMANIDIRGIHTHIGSQILNLAPFREAVRKLTALVAGLKKEGIRIEWIDVGGGLGITYRDETPPALRDYASSVVPLIKKAGCKAIFEPGRVIVGNAAILVTAVLYNKENAGKRFVVVDAGMGDLFRPSFYDAYHGIMPVIRRRGRKEEKFDVVGPICESGDYFAHDRAIAQVNTGELLAISSAGAYGFSMSSNYNMRRRPAEVLVRGKNYYTIRKRENYKDLARGEVRPGILK